MREYDKYVILADETDRMQAMGVPKTGRTPGFSPTARVSAVLLNGRETMTALNFA